MSARAGCGCGTYEVADEGGQLRPRRLHRRRPPDDRDQLLVGVGRRREDDASPCRVAHLADVRAAASDEELVELGARAQLGRVALLRLKAGRRS